MKASSLARLVRLSLARDVRGVVSSAFGVAVGVGSLVFFVALGLGVGKVIRERVFPVDARLVEVVPPTVSLGALLGGGTLDAATVERLQSLPGVERVHRKMNVRVPAISRYEGDFFGSRLRMGLEILAVGVEPELVRSDVVMGDFSDPGPGKPIPCLLSTRLLELYNKTFAPARRLPSLSPTLLTGFVFPVEFNRSFVAATAPGPVTATQLQVVGVSDRALLAGVTIPLSVAQRLNTAAGQDASTFSSVTLVARNPSLTPTLVEDVRKMGLEVNDQERRLADTVGGAVSLTTSALALLSLLICLLAGINIAHAISASVRARAREIGVMRAVGASRGHVQRLVLAEAGVIGLLGGVVGTGVAVGFAFLADKLSGAYLPPFPFKPESYFSLALPVILGGVLLGVGAALAGAFFPSRAAAATDPARTLAG